ncbi:hypothetical protein [Marinobacterium stanieri]|uniref:Uncharacterized protein n=1 Tax=Marinobacterium stanieri TaxID=49186 RepID=A0A1N6XCV6_9GAMM|nr:hypothetical protein [Marinobacterium stanieri]SIR00176.1 hypothetical protein SAMN05421647_11388 [Marinobacterium stanieri]
MSIIDTIFNFNNRKIRSIIGTMDFSMLLDLSHPLGSSYPTVFSETRCALEKIPSMDFGSYNWISTGANVTISAILSDLIHADEFDSELVISKLDGCFACKSFAHPRSPRGSARSMAEMGAIINDLRDLNGLNIDQQIQRCFEHTGIISGDTHVITDRWHNRDYWLNEGGGHHAAVLCTMLREHDPERSVEATWTRYSVNLPVLELMGNVACYVVQSESDITPTQLMGNRFLNADIDPQQFGIATQPMSLNRYEWSTDPLRDYHFVWIDMSRPAGELVRGKFEDVAASGQAMGIKEFFRRFC